TPPESHDISDFTPDYLYVVSNFEGGATTRTNGVAINGAAQFINTISDEENVKISFKLTDVTGDPKFAFGLLKNAGTFSVQTIDEANEDDAKGLATGLYFKFSSDDNLNTGKLNYVIKWVDESGKLTYVGDGGGLYGKFTATHVVQFKHGSNGIEIYLDEQRITHDGRVESLTDWSAITSETAGYHLAMGTARCTMNFGSDIVYHSPVAPVPNVDVRTLFAGNMSVGVDFTFAGLEFRDYSDSDVGVVVPYYITVVDPNNIETSLGANATHYTPEYSGIYIFRITATNDAGKSYATNVNKTAELPTGMPDIILSDNPSNNGRSGVVYNIVSATATVQGATVSITVIGPNGTTVATFNNFNANTFTPNDLGEYNVVYTATANGFTNKLLVRVYVKWNYGDKKTNVYNFANSADYWIGDKNQSGSAIEITGSAYTYLPFDIAENGLRVNVKLAFGSGLYPLLFITSNINSGNGFTIMFYGDGTNYFCNIYYGEKGNLSNDVVNYQSLGPSGDATFVIEKVKPDNVNLYINGAKNTNFGITESAKASYISDNENFSYISAGFNGGGSSGKYYISFQVGDTTAPEIKVKDDVTLPEKLDLNSVIKLDDLIEIIDNVGVASINIVMYDPNGRIVVATSEGYALSVEGEYYYTVEAIDNDGNKSFAKHVITVGDYQKSERITRGISVDFEPEDPEAVKAYGGKAFVYDVLFWIIVGGVAAAGIAAFVVVKVTKKKIKK
ncbi:MAG: hypothetical protein SPL13_02675, partial [Clostridia bacterium]|nr:hypothetical protein [Clostridia bacterium]